MANELIANMGFRKETGEFNAHDFAEEIEKAYKDKNRTSKYALKNFSPSKIGYGHGRCFTGDTRFMTSQGMKELEECLGKDIFVYAGGGQEGGWRPATIEYFGEQPIWEIELERHGMFKTIRTTEDHRWFVRGAKKSQRKQKFVKNTNQLNTGDCLWGSYNYVDKNIVPSPEGIKHGFVYGDGDIDITQPRSSARVKLFGSKDNEMRPWFDNHRIYYRGFQKGHNIDCSVVCDLPRYYKQAPPIEESASYLYGFLAGYFAADGNISSNGVPSISSSSYLNIRLIEDICVVLGISINNISSKNRMGINGKYSDLHTISFHLRSLNENFFLINSHRTIYNDFCTKKERRGSEWKVVSVTETHSVEPVYCAVQEQTERFTLEGNILTMNCPRYWHLGFNEANFIEDNSPLSIAVMKNGIAVHDRVRDFVEATGRLKDEERLVTNEDPPIKGYVDLVLDWNGKEIPGEAKSTRTEAFINRQSAMKPTGYHLIQILLYMYIMEVDEGFMLYENKNDQRLLLIPVNMTESNKKLLNTVLDWMRNVHELSKDKDSLPARPFRKNSKECKGCPLFDDCYALPKEGVEVDPLPKL